MERPDFPPAAEIRQASSYLRRIAGRVARGLMFSGVAVILILAGPYKLQAPTFLVMALGILGTTATGAKIAQVALGALLVLMILSPSVIEQILAPMR